MAPIEWPKVDGPAIEQEPVAASQEPPTPPAELLERQWQVRLAEAEAEWRRRCEAEYQRGLREGEALGMQRASAKVDPMVERMARSVAELAALKSRFRHEAEQDLVALSIAVARRILKRELQVDPEAILGLVKVATEKLALREVQTIRVHPEDVPAIRSHLEAIGPSVPVEVKADPALERGALLFETARGTMDAGLETQLQQIERGFADILERQR